MEGMAEYYAEDSDKSYTEMILRDAAISERLQPIIQLESFNHFDGREVVLMYKEAQSIFDYIAQNYGEDKIASL